MLKINFDFRTKLIIIFLTMSLVSILTSDILIYTLICALSVYLLIQGYKRKTIIYDIVLMIFIILRFFSKGNGITFIIPEMFLFMVLRMILMVMSAQPIIGMVPGEVVAVLKKIHTPDYFSLPFIFMLRFFPTVKSEFRDVFAALKLRKLLSIKHPLNSIEYIITPIIFRSSRISEELAASAECRGISNPGNHTCLRNIKFELKDWLMCVISICITVVYVIIEKMVI
ncbi:MAG: energy-coupling factor transporter transmembrane protein EcfT [Clostridium butyricum]|nr:energy-coupling factor transporter transmembrane protein EcfT [Clostridium butyricum]